MELLRSIEIGEHMGTSCIAVCFFAMLRTPERVFHFGAGAVAQILVGASTQAV